MTKAETQDEDLAGTDQAETQSQPDVWQQKYHGLKGKLMEVQNKLAEAKAGWQEERLQWEADRQAWDTERQALAAQAEQLNASLFGAESQLGELTGKWNELSAQSEGMAAQLARQQLLLKYPQLVNGPTVKLVQTSSMAAEDLEATLAAMAESQQHLVKQVYREAQTGATAPVSPPAAQAGAQQEQAKETWKAALEALQKGDMAQYQEKYGEYLAYLDQNGQSRLASPQVLSRPI